MLMACLSFVYFLFSYSLNTLRPTMVTRCGPQNGQLPRSFSTYKLVYDISNVYPDNRKDCCITKAALGQMHHMLLTWGFFHCTMHLNPASCLRMPSAG
jgi:hypothetical protein